MTQKKYEPKKKENANKMDKKMMNMRKQKTPRIKLKTKLKHLEADTTACQTSMTYVYENFMEDNKKNHIDDDSSDTSPQQKPLTKKERKNNKKELFSGIPKSSGGAAGSK